MLEPGRNYSVANTNYRYGFNGKEKSGEINGSGVDYDYGARIFDARLGRFLSVDPLADDFPWNSVYSFAEGDPVNYIDLDGKEKAKSSDPDGDHTAALLTATARGAGDAYHNAVLDGVPDLLPVGWGSTDHSGDYSSPDLQQAYLNGRATGDVAAIAQGEGEVTTGAAVAEKGGQLALSTGAETEGLGGIGGGIVAAGGGALAAHGALMQTAAAADALKVAAKLLKLNVPAKTSTNSSANSQTNSAHGSNSASNSNTASKQSAGSGTPRKKSTAQLRKEWEDINGKNWPKEPENPSRNQVAHHTKPLADKGIDDGSNIEPKLKIKHINDHKANGDFKRWAKRRGQ